VSNRHDGLIGDSDVRSVSVSSAAAPAPVISGVFSDYGIDRESGGDFGYWIGGTQGGSAVLLNGAAVTSTRGAARRLRQRFRRERHRGRYCFRRTGMNDSNAVSLHGDQQPLPASWLDQDVGAVG